MTKYICVLALYSIFNSSCKKLVEIDPPASDLVRETVFNNDETACRSILGVYSILTNGLSFASGGFSSFSYLASLSADELLTTNSGYQLPDIRFDILNAYFFPDGDYSAMYPEISPVNTFRVVFDTYFSEEYPLLKDQSINVGINRPYGKKLMKPGECP